MNAVIKQVIKPALVSLAGAFGPHTRASKIPRLWLLMYHRVLIQADERYRQEEPGMLVRPETLEMHIQEIKRQFELMPLGEWVNARLNNLPLPQNACAITFDDGWADNFEYALPVLKAHSAPATLFAVAEKIGTDFQFWPNIVAILLLSGKAREMSGHHTFGSIIKSVFDKPSADEIAEIIRQLKRYSDEQIFSALAEINWRSLCQTEIPSALMGWDQLKEMKSSGLVDIGSHTCTHRRLTNDLSQADLEYEIVHSRSILEEKLASPVDLFCFPNGDYNEAALSLVKRHYRAGVTTQRGIVHSEQAKMHELSRIGLHDEISWSRRLFRARLSGWI